MVDYQMKTYSEMVQEFNETFGLTNKSPEFYLKLVEEEYNELKESLVHTLKELCDYEYVFIGYLLAGGPLEELAKYEIDGLVALYISFDEAFRRVHESNMSKVGLDGKPLFREDGKLLKGPNYKPPNLDDLIV